METHKNSTGGGEAMQASEKLAIDGGPAAVSVPGPANFLHGPNAIGEEEIDAVTATLRSRHLFRFMKPREDSPVARFEDLFAQKAGVPHALAVNSGTSALIAGLVGIGVGQGDEVLVPGYTYIASAAAALALGAFPVIVEVDASLTMDPDDLANKTTSRTRAIMPVHMRGMPCDMAKIMAFANARKLTVLEDCAQANGGRFQGRALGAWGDAGAFSLQHFKIITAGEGGVLATRHPSVMERAAMYHDSAYLFWMESQGDEAEREHWKRIAFLGENYRMSELNGALAYEQLKKRDGILARTREIKARFSEACADIPGAVMETVHDREGDCGISLAFFMENAENARRMAETLQAEGVPSGTRFSKHIPDRHIFYHWDYIIEKRTPHASGFPWTCGEHAWPGLYTRDMCPKTVQWLERVVTLTITQTMSDDYVDQVCKAIGKVARAWRPNR